MNPETQEDNNVPVFGSWKGWYIFLLVVLAIQIVIYTWLTLKYQ